MRTGCVRRRWLLGLLVMQSSSSFVLDRYEDLLKEHIFVTLFLVSGCQGVAVLRASIMHALVGGPFRLRFTIGHFSQTMLVGAGGNAGNQSAIKVIRGLATGTLEPTLECLSRSLRQQV